MADLFENRHGGKHSVLPIAVCSQSCCFTSFITFPSASPVSCQAANGTDKDCRCPVEQISCTALIVFWFLLIRVIPMLVTMCASCGDTWLNTWRCV